MRKQRVSARRSGTVEAAPRFIRGHFGRELCLAAVAAACAATLACSAYDNATTPGHALGTGADSNETEGGTGGSQASTGSGGSLAQGGAATGLAGASGIAGSVAQAGAAAGGSGGSAGASGSSGAGGVSGTAGGMSGGAGGASGTGGGSNGMCSAHPLTAMSKWTVTASSSDATDVPARAIDGDLTTRWSTGKDQSGDEWLQVDFSADVTVTKVTLELGSNTMDYPRSYKTRLTDTANNLAAPAMVMGNGQAGVDTVMTFDAPTTGRYLLITQGGMATGLWWSVAEISVECTG